MKYKILPAFKLALVLIVLFTFGCATSPGVVSTPIAEVESSPVATSTPVPTATPEPLPDLSTARISLDELPQGFEEIATDAMLMEQKASGEENLPDAFFAYINTDDFQVIMGMNFLLVDVVDRLGFGSAFSDADQTLKDFAGAMGGQNIRETQTLEGMEGVGEKQRAITMLADVEGVPMRVDALIFQRDIVGGIIMTMWGEGETANISIQELGQLFDQHMQESLNTVE
jgi:hypothetical protein